jgi:cation transport ATPase
MSYAQVAAKGPKQSPEEARAHPLPEIEHSDASTESLIDVDSVHVNTVPPDFESQPVQTDTQAERLEREAEDEDRALEAEYDEVKREAKRAAKEKAHQAKVKAQEAKAKAEAKAEEAKAKAETEAKKAIGKTSKVAKSTSKDLQENSDNPVIIGNAVVVAALSAALGFGAYRKYAAGQLTWKVVGAWAGVIGLFAAGDFYLSQYLFRNRYPKK